MRADHSGGGRRVAARVDLGLGAAILAATVLYLAAFPRDLGMSDESYFLYEAARIRNGEVMYRDIFQFITPLSAYAMALLFALFGTTIDTARLAMAVLHGAVAALLFAICRRLGVRRGLALGAALVYLTVSQPVWPYASWHWFSTLLTVLLLWSMLAAPWRTRPRAAFAPGLIAGALIGVQQQKGVILAAAMVVVLLSTAAPPRLRPRWTRLSSFALGVVAVMAPLLAFSVATAGFKPVYDDLVRWPLETYGTHFHVAWGKLGLLSQSYADLTYPRLLRWSPLALVPLLLRVLAALATRRRDFDFGDPLLLLVAAVASIVSILYYPDIIHIAFIAPLLVVCAVEAVDWALTQLRLPRVAGALSWVAAAALFAVVAPRLAVNLERARRTYPIEHDTAFGRVAFANRWQPILIDHVRALLRDVPSRQLFCYANVSSPYLTMGAQNPTPFQFFIAGLSPDSQTRAVLETLVQRRLPYILGAPFFMKPGDPVVRFIEENYSRVDLEELQRLDEPVGLVLYRRNDLPPPAGDPSPASRGGA